MRRALFVAEKNDVAKGVAAILSNGTSNRKEGRSKFNKIYTLNTELFGQPTAVSVTSVSGHLMNWQFHENMANWQTTSMVQLFDAPVRHVVTPEMKLIEQTLREEARRHDVLVVWTDCDREGEAIGAEIVKVCRETNRQMDIYRARFSEITKVAITRAARNLIRLDEKIVAAVDCRSELDLRIGSAFTRLQTLHLRNRFRDLLGQNENSKVISYGSCQFPTLGFVTDRYKMIENFISEPFWKLVVEHTRETHKVEFLWDRVRLFDRDTVEVLHEDCNEAKEAVVEKVTKKPKSKWRPQALDTVELEKLGISKLRMSAKQTMQVAEKLYSKGYISYPRTETNKFPAGLDLRPLVQQQTNSGIWGDFANEVLQNGINPRNGRKSDEAHPPIHPLSFVDRTQLQGDDWKVYELVVRHFLACVSQDAQGEETMVNLRIGGEKFHSSGLRIRDMGYLKVYIYERWGNRLLPTYVEGERFSDYNLRIGDGKTQPPELLTEADLIALMDKFGIGTDATHAEHIEKIKTREYIGVKPDGKLIPSFLGLALVDGYDDMGFAMSKPDLRANLEIGLKEICEGRRQKQQVLDEQIGKYKAIFVESERNIEVLSQSLQRYLNKNQQGGGGGGNGGGGPPRGPGGGGGGAGPRGPGAPKAPPKPRGRPAKKSVTPQKDDGDDDNETIVTLSEVFGSLSNPKPGRKPRAPRKSAPKTSAPQGIENEFEETEQVMCSCPEPKEAVIKVVQKEGPNKGKKFYTCSLPYTSSEKCNFFKWV
ncbi:CBN-TOP-3 protein [Caenorhabditis brenneri]|uniref:DNA topoisomerase n=1 Tax=Caenorhabditis brenneri TaxID=135651 RepID=G0NRK3_CAEBE|nr:CBN-TOP-3 protein [Caenorhabditis brenneri]